MPKRLSVILGHRIRTVSCIGAAPGNIVAMTQSACMNGALFVTRMKFVTCGRANPEYEVC
jgi:hypothetical protein